jgi:hypothetical protein
MQRRATFFVCALPGRRRYCRQGRGNFSQPTAECIYAM